jgi:hypothetical protein
MRWAPDGRNIVAKWDFVVENDWASRRCFPTAAAHRSHTPQR